MSLFGLLVVGAPRGAMAEVEAMLAVLPTHLPAPVALAVHRGRHDELVGSLGRRCALPVVEPDDKDDLQAGRVYLAPAGYHLLVDRGGVVLSYEPPERGHRPAIDPLFESAADSYGPAAVGLLFGGHEDGWAGLAALRARGGRVAVVGEGYGGLEGAECVPLHAVATWLARLANPPRSKARS